MVLSVLLLFVLIRGNSDLVLDNVWMRLLPLFDRLGKKVVLPHYGQRFLSYAVKIIELHSLTLNTDEEPTGNLTIGISESLTIGRIPPILLDY